MDSIAFYNTSFLLSTVTFKPSCPDAFKDEKRTALMLIVFPVDFSLFFVKHCWECYNAMKRNIG
ncbi:hypothetical protein HMPREF0971_00132 [Segatella oris F0302]|uniref:Uncharacterized protein n=1 Tax=Segatella oris F0302 TaxID=649760 RepID=D1QM99_9BACT|nr:hypothetical protein HMPREF0971_00132 [Segatella oris F0302]